MMKTLSLIGALAVLVAGCASLEFGNHTRGVADGMVYYDPIPHAVVGCAKEGATINIVMLPDVAHPHFVRPGEGWGSSKQSATVTNGILTSFSQETDPQLQHAGSLLGAIGGILGLDGSSCTQVGLYRIEPDPQGGVKLVEVAIPD